MSQTDRVDPARIDSLAKTTMPALGIDLGGTKISAAAVCNNQLISDVHQVPTPGGREHIIEALNDMVAHFQKDFNLAGIGIATAGIVNCDTGEVIGSTGNLPGWAGTRLKEIIESKALVPVHVENDANAAAYGESRVEGLRGKRCIVAVTLGTGIGGGIVLDGRLYKGADWGAGEIGHIKISMDNKRLCTCGLFDCWEAYGAGRGLVQTGKDMLSGISKEQTPLAADVDKLTTHAIFDSLKSDDILAQKIVNTWHEHVAYGMVNLAHILNPDAFVVTGGLSKYVDFQLLHDMVVDRCLPTIGRSIEIKQSQLQNHAGIIGAAQFVIEELLSAKR